MKRSAGSTFMRNIYIAMPLIYRLRWRIWRGWVLSQAQVRPGVRELDLHVVSKLRHDAKQFTGLGHCQARGQGRLDFYFNASLAALNLAKVDVYPSFDYNLAGPFSMATQKIVCFNEHLLEKVFSILELDPSLIKCNPDFGVLRTYGAIAPSASI